MGKPLRWGPGTGLPFPAMVAQVHPSSHKSDLNENTTLTTGRRVSVEPCDDLIPHRDTAGVDIPEDCQALFCLENLSAGVLIKMATVDLTLIKSCWLGACVCWVLSYWGNKDKRKPSGFFFLSFLSRYCETSQKTLFVRGVGGAGTCTAIPYLQRVQRRGDGGRRGGGWRWGESETEGKLSQEQVTLIAAVGSGGCADGVLGVVTLPRELRFTLPLQSNGMRRSHDAKTKLFSSDRPRLCSRAACKRGREWGREGGGRQREIYLVLQWQGKEIISLCT